MPKHIIEDRCFRRGLEGEVTQSIGIAGRSSGGRRAPANFQSWGGLNTVGSPDWDREGERDSRDERTMRWILKMTAEG